MQEIGNNIKKHKLALKNRSRRDRESNHGPPACRANHYTIAALPMLNANLNGKQEARGSIPGPGATDF